MCVKLIRGVVVVVNFMHQLGWVTVPRYLVKHYSGCFYKSVFRQDLHSNQWPLSKADYPP